MVDSRSRMIERLKANGPHPDLVGKPALSGHFIADGDFGLTGFSPEGMRFGTGHGHFDWVLEGRAMRDMWDRRTENRAHTPANTGSILPFYDSTIDA